MDLVKDSPSASFVSSSQVNQVNPWKHADYIVLSSLDWPDSSEPSAEVPMETDNQGRRDDSVLTIMSPVLRCPWTV